MSAIPDNARLESLTAWRPKRDARRILADVDAWVAEHERDLPPPLVRSQ